MIIYNIFEILVQFTNQVEKISILNLQKYSNKLQREIKSNLNVFFYKYFCNIKIHFFCLFFKIFKEQFIKSIKVYIFRHL